MQKKFPRTSFLLHSVEPVLSFQQLQASNDHFLVTSLNSVTWPEKYSHSCYGHIEWTLLYPKTDDLLENSLPIWTLCSITPSLFQELSFPGNRPLQVIQVQSYQSLYQACQQEQPFMAIVPTRLRTQFSNQRLQVKRLSKKVSSDLELSLIWLNNHDYEIATYISDYFKSNLSELGVIGKPLTTK